MEQVPDIAAELKEISTLVAGIKKNNPFSVPAGYFAEFSENVLSLVLQNESTAVPVKDEIEALSPLLASLRNKSSLTIPEHYFEQFSIPAIPAPQESKDGTAIAPVRSISANRKWIKYAAAAMVAGFVGLSTFFFLNRSANPAEKDKTVVQHDKNHSANDFSGIPDEALAGFLSSAPVNSFTATDSDEADIDAIAMIDIDDNKLTNILRELPDEDLISYAEDTRNEDVSL
ncbi:MAG: hypothetical protein QM668_03615 [Agriterribacter sp.]